MPEPRFLRDPSTKNIVSKGTCKVQPAVFSAGGLFRLASGRMSEVGTSEIQSRRASNLHIPSGAVIVDGFHQAGRVRG